MGFRYPLHHLRYRDLHTRGNLNESWTRRHQNLLRWNLVLLSRIFVALERGCWTVALADVGDTCDKVWRMHRPDRFGVSGGHWMMARATGTQYFSIT